uniref:copper amine oxidase N-terminal domain-containing protein n=1 Tax=Paenibacillus terrae TaxID=159743 RepID=UPI0011A54471|nr:copper amine oxidase N-terminal domain-containing protein [Paenibacillus terrae]
MKIQKTALLTSVLLAAYGVVPASAASDLEQEPTIPQKVTTAQAPAAPSGTTVIYLNSSRILNSGTESALNRSTVVKKGVTFVSLRSLAVSLGCKVTYQASTKETTVSLEGTEARYRVHTKAYQVNGETKTMKGEAYEDRGVLMVPLTSLTTAFHLPYVLQGNQITLHPGGSGSSGTDKPEGPQTNEPPQAYFTTDKDQYRIGEPVTLSDQSTDDEDAITNREWTNNEPVFFEPGTVEIKLKVTDKHGLTSEYSKKIEITSEVMYSKEEYAMRFTPADGTFQVSGKSILSYKALPYTYTTEPYLLFRASGPETVNSEGILYQDILSGPARFLVHHKNNLAAKARFYLIATNSNDTAASIQVESSGVAGPTPYPELSGRLAGVRYLESTLTGSEQRSVQIGPGESVALFPKLNATAAAPGDVITMNADVTSDAPVEYTMLMVQADHDPIAVMPSLPDLNPIESIVRGTFADSTRVFEYDGTVGTEAERLPLTDNTTDPFQRGMDGMQDSVAINSGNYGVLYKIILNHVAPDTLVAFNPRGGRYFGSARVNDRVVEIKHGDGSQDSATVLYRTQAREEKVELWLSPAAGSNLPFSLLFLPISEK